MPSLVILDLDNTLVDRDTIFRRWAEAFAREHGSNEPDDLRWLLDLDDDGMVSRVAFFEAVKDRYGLVDTLDALIESYWKTQLADFRCTDETLAALARLREAGHVLGIATNGRPAQEDKIRVAGLDRLVDGWCVSGLAGAAKPDARIFEALAEQCAVTLEGAWVVGDRADADIAGAVAIGARSIWIHRGRTWSTPHFRPTFEAGSMAEAASLILAETEAA